MYIKSLHLENFKRFKDLRIEFKPEINIIYGLNEQGKSSLISGIITALFYNPLKENLKILENKSWFSESLFRTEICFCFKDQKFLLTKDFENKQIFLKNKKTDETWQNQKKIEEKLEKEIGLSSPLLYETTACIRQEMVARIDQGQKELQGRLQQIISGGEKSVNILNVLKILEEKILDYEKGLFHPAKFPGKIKKVSDQIKEKEKSLAELKEEVERNEKIKISLKEYLEKINHLRKEIETEKKILETNFLLERIEERLKNLHQEFDQLLEDIEEIKDKEREKNQIEEKIKTDFPQLKEENLENLEKKILSLSQNISLERERLKIEKFSQKRNKQIIRIFGFGLSAFGLIGLFINKWLILLLLFGIGFIILGLKKTAKKEEKEIEKLKSELENSLSKFGFENQEDFQRKKKEFLKEKQRSKDISNQIKGKLGKRNLENLEEQKRNLIKIIHLEEVKITQEMKNQKISQKERENLARDLQKKEKDLEALQGKYKQGEGILKGSKKNIEDQINEEEELEILEEELKREKEGLDIYKQTYSFLKEAKEKVLSQGKDFLKREIEKNLEFITEGRYDKIEIEKDLEFRVFSKEKKEMIKPEKFLSQGTIDQFYLLSRFALVKFLFKENLPLILDDPFVNFDQPRFERVMELLKKLSQDFQILIFSTRKEDFQKYGNLIRLQKN